MTISSSELKKNMTLIIDGELYQVVEWQHRKPPKAPPKAPPKKGKDFRDFKTVAAAQAAGFDYFQGKDGKKKIAVTREQLERYKNKNKIKTNSEALTSYANMLRRK